MVTYEREKIIVNPNKLEFANNFKCFVAEHDALRARASQLRSIINISETLFFRYIKWIAGVRDEGEIAKVPPLAATAGLWFLFLRHGMNKCISGPD